MTLILQFITVVGKLYSVEGTLPGVVYDTYTPPSGVYVTDTTVYYCCR
jgi:hypothetical protein